MEINLIVAVCKKFGIGKNNIIPWDIKADRKKFKEITENSIVVMGRKTYYSIDEKVRPLKNRYNIVITHTPQLQELQPHIYNNLLFCDMETCNNELKKIENKPIYIIGGEQIYTYFIENYKIHKIYITYIDELYECDTYFKELNNDKNDKNNFKLVEYSEKYKDPVSYRFLEYVNTEKITDEYEYLHLLRNILKNGKKREDRTGTGTIAVFGNQMRFDVSESIPLLTTKFVSWRAIIEELLWFLRGDTNSKALEEKGIHIWKGNTTSEFLKSRGLDYNEGDIGAMYGWVWRHYGAKYKGCNGNYEGKGIDQFKEVIEMLKTDPYSRRIMMTTYDPSVKDKGCLIPCHGINLQFYVEEEINEKDEKIKYVSCSMLQRSSDSFLGLPLNIASYTVLLYIICKLVNMKPKEVIINTNDTHIYMDHIEAVQLQLSRKPYPFPKLHISDEIIHLDIKHYTMEHFDLIGYLYHPMIKAKMSV